MAPAVVLLHPFPLDPSAWDAVAASLRPRHEVHAPALPGFGGAARLARPSIDGYADAIAALIADLAPARVVVAGNSMGGYVALSLAARRPELLAGLALVDTKAEGDDPAQREARDRGIATIRDEGPAPFLDALLPRLLAPGAPGALARHVRAIADRQDPEGLADALAAMRDRPDRSPDLAGIDAPSLVVVGEEDAGTPPGVARALAGALPRARLEIVPRAGHLVPLEDPATLARLLEELLEDVAGRP